MNRVVVTGLGTINPLGNNVISTWEAAQKGNNNFEYYEKLNVTISRVRAELSDFLSKREQRYQDRVSQLAMVSTMEAVNDSALLQKDLDRAIIGVGTSIGGVNTTVEETKKATQKPIKAIGIRTIIKMLPNMIASNLSIKLGIHGSITTYSAACASGSVSIGETFRKLQNGDADVGIVIGAESCLNDEAIEAFKKLGVLSDNQDLDKASVPFMNNRSGFVMSEGASTIILENMGHALKRNARIYGEILGYGNYSDGLSLVAPSSEGMILAMKQAILDAKIDAQQVAYINAHGTSTIANDREEANAISSIFSSNKTKVSSTKAIFGHMLGGSGTLEALLCMKMLEKGICIQQFGINNTNLDNTSENFSNMLLRSNSSLKNYVMSNSFAFGGTNAVLIFGKVN